MVKPSSHQHAVLSSTRRVVLQRMQSIDVFDKFNLSHLENIKLGVLRKNATQRHGVTRWSIIGGEYEVKVVELHPVLLSDEWNEYRQFVLYHEFIHCLGFRAHDATFFHYERHWPIPESKQIGSAFTLMLQQSAATHVWTCPKCQIVVYRRKQNHGKYMCKSCRVTLQSRALLK